MLHNMLPSIRGIDTILQAFLTDVLFNSPRMRFSRAQQKAILSWAKELGATVPAYHNVQKIRATLKEELGDPTTRVKTSRDNVFYLNEIGASIAKVETICLSSFIN